MIPDLKLDDLTSADQKALTLAVKSLENPNFAARLSEYAGVPINRVLGALPRVAGDRLAALARTAIMRALNLAIETLDESPPAEPMTVFSSVLAGATGGISGMFGMAALPIELPLTTTLMLRAIAEIARHQGEDISKIETRLACLEVFAYGAKRSGEHVDLGYYAARALLNRYANDVAALAFERGAVDVTAPVVGGLVSEIAARFGLVVSDKLAAGALPILGAVGGATVNVVFMDHFQRIAHAHFNLRRLERTYGSASIREHYARLAALPPPASG